MTWEQKVEQYKNKGNFEKALHIIQWQLAKDPYNEKALLQVADIKYAQWSLDEAEKPVDFLLSIGSGDNAMGLYVKWVLEMERWNWRNSKDFLKKAMINSTDDNPEMMRCYALAEYQSGNIERWIEYLEKAFKVNDCDAEIIHNLVDMYLTQNDYSKVARLINHYEDNKKAIETFWRNMDFYDAHIAQAKKLLLNRNRW